MTLPKTLPTGPLPLTVNELIVKRRPRDGGWPETVVFDESFVA